MPSPPVPRDVVAAQSFGGDWVGTLTQQRPSRSRRCRAPCVRALRGCGAGCRQGSEPRNPWHGWTPVVSHHLWLSPMEWLKGAWVAQQPALCWPHQLGACLPLHSRGSSGSCLLSSAQLRGRSAGETGRGQAGFWVRLSAGC